MLSRFWLFLVFCFFWYTRFLFEYLKLFNLVFDNLQHLENSQLWHWKKIKSKVLGKGSFKTIVVNTNCIFWNFRLSTQKNKIQFKSFESTSAVEIVDWGNWHKKSGSYIWRKMCLINEKVKLISSEFLDRKSLTVGQICSNGDGFASLLKKQLTVLRRSFRNFSYLGISWLF